MKKAQMGLKDAKIAGCGQNIAFADSRVVNNAFAVIKVHAIVFNNDESVVKVYSGVFKFQAITVNDANKIHDAVFAVKSGIHAGCVE